MVVVCVHPVIIQLHFPQSTTHFLPDPHLRLKVRVKGDILSLSILTHPRVEEHHAPGVGTNCA